MSSITETPLARCSLSFAGSAPVLGSFKSALAKYDEVHVAFGNGEPVVTTMRKTNLAHLLARRVDGIHLAPF